MITWDDAQSIAQELVSDFTSDTLITLKRYMNVGYKFLLSQLSRPLTEKTSTSLTVANQQFYQLPPDYLFLKSVTVKVGGFTYNVSEEESQEKWNLLNSTVQTGDIPLVYFLRPSFGVSGAEIGFYPIPATSGNVITIVYEASDRDMFFDKVTTGTVSVTNGSATVTGSGTSFNANMVGRYFQITSPSSDGMWYRIASFTSSTQITLENVYEGPSGANLNYQIVDMFALPEEMQILPCYYAAAHYFSIKNNPNLASMYWSLFYDQLKLGMRRHSQKSRSSIVKGKKYLSIFEPATPNFFPDKVS